MRALSIAGSTLVLVLCAACAQSRREEPPDPGRDERIAAFIERDLAAYERRLQRRAAAERGRSTVVAPAPLLSAAPPPLPRHRATAGEEPPEPERDRARGDLHRERMALQQRRRDVLAERADLQRRLERAEAWLHDAAQRRRALRSDRDLIVAELLQLEVEREQALRALAAALTLQRAAPVPGAAAEQAAIDVASRRQWLHAIALRIHRREERLAAIDADIERSEREAEALRDDMATARERRAAIVEAVAELEARIERLPPP